MTDEVIRKRDDVEVESKAGSLPEAEIARMTDDIVAALKTVYDPEIPADIYDDADHAELPFGAGVAADGRERGGERARRQRRQGQHRLGPAVGPEPHVRRGAARAQHVVSCDGAA
jgi:hypothetical protein